MENSSNDFTEPVTSSVLKHRQQKFLTRRGKHLRRQQSSSAPPILRTPEKVKRKKWADTQMQAAMKVVGNEICGVNQATTDHGVPKTTLKDRLSGQVTHSINRGLRPYLDKTEVDLSFIKRCSSIGYGKTRKDILNIAESVCSF